MPLELIKAVGSARRMTTNPNAIWRYGFAIVVVLAATGVRLAFNPVLGVEAPHMPFNLAVIIAAWFGGSGPGLMAAALSAFSVDWFFVEPLHSPFITSREGVWGLALYVITVSLIALLVGSLRALLLARARAEARLRRQAHLINLAHDAIITTDSERRIVTWNHGAEQMYGWSESEAVGKTLHELLQTCSPISTTEIDASLLRERQWDGELSHTARDGQRLAVESRQVLIRDNQNFPVSILEINRDVTERKRVEEALRHSEERFRVALTNAPVVVFNQDCELRYTWINSPVLAWANQDYLGRSDTEILGGEEGARLTAIKQGVLRSGRGVRTEVEVTFQGETYYFDLVAEPLRDCEGTLLGLTCSASDITPTKRSLLEREGLIANLQDALEEVKLLSGLLSICASCKKITNERGDWEPLESYLQTHSQAKFSHGVCPDCLRKLYPEQYRTWEHEVQASTGAGRASDIREARLRDDRTKK